MKKLLSLLLILPLLLTACSAPAETAGAGTVEAETAGLSYRIFLDLVETQGANPSEGKGFSDPEDIAAYCEKIYGYIDPALAGDVFYGGPEEMTALMKQMYQAIIGVDDIYADAGLDMCESIYVYIWEILHMEGLPVQSRSRPAVKENLKQALSSFPEEGLSEAVDISFDYIAKYEPELEAGSYTVYGDGTRPLEGNEEYLEHFNEGFRLFEEGKYTEAITEYRKCLEIKENDPVASFEIAEAYIAMRDYPAAKAWLAVIAPTLQEDTYIAQWLRRLGFIAVEEGDYQRACALYVCSLNYEDSDNAKQELDYIMYVAPDTTPFTPEEAQEYLLEHGM